MDPQPRAERVAQAILVVDADESMRRILDLSLRHAGFVVGLAGTSEEAAARLADRPDLLIANASDPGALELCRQTKQTTEQMPPAVVLICEPGIENKMRGLEAGADDFVVKPIYVQEVVARERLELSANTPASSAEDAGAPRTADSFVSDIGDVPLVDLLRAIAAHQRSGVAVITAEAGTRGEIFFRQGNVVDAEVGRLSGRDAVYRLFCWSAGRLDVEWKSVRRKDTVEMRPQDLLMEGLRRVDDWRRLLADLPPLGTVLEVDYRLLAERLADIPDEVNRILRLCDGVRSILQVIDDCGLSDLDAAAALGKLYRERIVRDGRVRPSETEDADGADMENWLSEATGPFRSPPRLEPDLFGASPETAGGVHDRPTGPMEPLADGARDADLDEEMRARFTDRLTAEVQAVEPVDDGTPSLGGLAFPKTLPGLGRVAVDPVPSLPAAIGLPSEMTDPVEEAAAPLAAGQEDRTAGQEGRASDATATGESSSASPASQESAPIEPNLQAVPMPPAGAQPAGMDPRSASGEIVVGPARARIKQSPAAEVRLAHLREESARALVRPSQSVTPAGSARALDEPPPLLEGPLPEPPVRKPEALAVRRATTDEFTVADEAAELGFGSRRRGRLLIGTVALAVIAGGLFLMERRRSESSSDLVAEPSGSAGSGPPPVAPTILPLPSPPSAGAGTANDPSAAATAHGLDAGAPGGDAVERDADPKMARARAGDAAVYLNACHLAFQEQRMKDAEAACTAARDANPDSAEAQGWLAHALFNRNRRREALVAAERAVRLNPKWADAYVIIGGVHQDVGEVDDAKRAYQRYLELDPHGQYSGDLRAIVDRLGKL